MQLYQQFVDFCQSLLKKVTTQWLIYGALMLLSFFLVWIVFAAITSSVRRFYIKCDKLEWFLIHKNIGYDKINEVDPYCRKISRSFAHAWNKFKKSKGKKPSDFLTKREVLDSEVSDGVLNHGKTLMKTFIGITTVLLFIFNLALLGKDSTLKFGIFVESMFLPFVYYVVMMLMYFISNLIRHHLYIVATAHFYTVVDELDDCFKEREPSVFETSDLENKLKIEENKHDDEQELDIAQTETFDEKQSDDLEEVGLKQNEINDEISSSETDNSQNIEQQTEENGTNENVVVDQSGRFDLSAFKINPDVKKQDETQDDFQQSVNDEFETNDNQESEEATEESDKIQAAPIARNWEAEENLEYFDVFKKKNINVDKYINEIPKEEEFNSPFINVNGGYVPTDDLPEESSNNPELFEESIIETNHPLDEFENINQIINEQEIGEDVFKFDEKHEDNRNEEVIIDNNSEQTNELDEIKNLDIDESSEDEIDNENEVEEDESDENFLDDSSFNLNDLLSFGEETEEELKTGKDEIETEDFDFFESESDNNESDIDIFDGETEGTDEEIIQNNELKNQIEQNLNDSSKEIDSKLEENIETNIDLSAIVGEFKQNYHQDNTIDMVEDKDNASEQDDNKISETVHNNSELAKDLYAKINDLEDLIHSAISNKNMVDEKSIKKRKIRKGKTKMTTENIKKSRGRPKIQAIDENLVITNEEQFEEILSRAEKLMRKSESGLSQSQSKRIEKELKIMMDAMNKYKEGK